MKQQECSNEVLITVLYLLTSCGRWLAEEVDEWLYKVEREVVYVCNVRNIAPKAPFPALIAVRMNFMSCSF